MQNIGSYLPPCYPQASVLAVNRFPHSFIHSFIYSLPPCPVLDSSLEELAQRLYLLPDLGREQETGQEMSQQKALVILIPTRVPSFP